MPTETMPQDIQFESDFNVEEEFTPEPLAPAGTYRGNVTQVGFDPENQAIVWTVVLQGNGSIMSDGKTEVDGSKHFYRNWLPRSGDENTLSKGGRSDKRTTKINMLKRFADGMKIQMNTKEDIIEGITTGLWMGIPVLCKISISTYQGQTRNQMDSMTRDETGETITVTPNNDDIPF